MEPLRETQNLEAEVADLRARLEALERWVFAHLSRSGKHPWALVTPCGLDGNCGDHCRSTISCSSSMAVG